MGGLGDFLKQAADWIKGWWPFRIVREWEQGIRVQGGAITKLLTHNNARRPFPGVHAFWPRLGQVIVEECNWDVAETPPQTLPTCDGHSVTVAFAIQYRIRDLRLYYTNIHDQEPTIVAQVRGAAGQVVPELGLEGLQKTLPEAMAEAVRRNTYGWGLEIRHVTPTTIVEAQALRLIGDKPGTPSTYTE